MGQNGLDTKEKGRSLIRIGPFTSITIYALTY